MKPSAKLLPQNRIVAMAVKRMLLGKSAKAGAAAAAVCTCQHHEDAHNGFSGATSWGARTFNYTSIPSGGVIISQAITITEECCVLAVATLLVWDLMPPSPASFGLERPLGTSVMDQQHSQSAGAPSGPVLLQWSSWEVLPPGTYTYYLVSHMGGSVECHAAHLKILAFACVGTGCEYHNHAYNEWSGDFGVSRDINFTSFANNATILSQAITLTSECCVLAVAEIAAVATYALTDFELERPLGTIVVDQEDSTVTNEMELFHYSSWEVLPPGTYTYYLVNRSGGTKLLSAAHLKIIAEECVV